VLLVEAELVRRLAVDETARRRRRLDVLLGDGVQLDPAPEEIKDLRARGRRLETAGLAVRARDFVAGVEERRTAWTRSSVSAVMKETSLLQLLTRRR
jgi:hypothetical protein